MCTTISVFHHGKLFIDWIIVIRIVCDLITFPSWQIIFSLFSSMNVIFSSTRIQHIMWSYSKNIANKWVYNIDTFFLSRISKIRHLLHSFYDSTTPGLSWHFSWCAFIEHFHLKFTSRLILYLCMVVNNHTHFFFQQIHTIFSPHK